MIHENPDWYGPFAAAFDAEGVPHEEWLLDGGLLDLDAPPPHGVFWSRMSASSHTRGHLLAKEFSRSVLCWLESHGRRVVNGRGVLELEMSKVDQLTALRAAGFDVPRTIAVAGRGDLVAAACKLRAPFISKHNQGGKGLGVRRFDSHGEFAAHVVSPRYAAPVDGITLLQEYVRAAQPFITRVEVVGGEFVYAITADTARGGFELCPADACAVDRAWPPLAVDPAWAPLAGDPAGALAGDLWGALAGDLEGALTGSPARVSDTLREPGLFALREGFDHPIVARYLEFARAHGIEIAGFEFIESEDGRLVTCDVNATTNYNPGIEAAAPRPALRQVARYLGRLLAERAERGRR